MKKQKNIQEKVVNNNDELEKDPWYDNVLAVVNHFYNLLTSDQILQCIGKPNDNSTTVEEEKRLIDILQPNGWSKKKVKNNGETCYVWDNPNREV